MSEVIFLPHWGEGVLVKRVLLVGKHKMEDLKAHIELLKDMGVTEVTLSGPDLSPTTATLESIRSDLGDCQRCRLAKTRTHIVYGVGAPKARLMFVGEAPGHDEDLKAEPFVGRAGQLLTKMIEAMGYNRSTVYIANIVKCRPPDNRYPEPDEVAACMPFLLQQIDAIHPDVIITLGNLATQTLLGTKTGITALHGNFQDWRGFCVMPTYHPAFLLRNPNMKKPCWEDLQKVMAVLKTSRPV